MVIPRRTEEIKVEGTVYYIQELSAREAFQIWDALDRAEKTGDRAPAYFDLVALGLRYPGGTRVFDGDDADAVGEWPSRIVIPIAERILAMSEVQLDSGEALGGQGNDSATP